MRNYGLEETKSGIYAVIDESGVTKQKLANLLRRIGDEVEHNLDLQRLHNKKINVWYNNLTDNQQRDLVGEGIIRGPDYCDQNYGLWSYLRKEDQEQIIKFRKQNPNYPIEGDGS